MQSFRPIYAYYLVGALYLVYLLAPAVGYMHDDGIYLVTAKSLAQGHGYRIESLPGEIFQTKYPILYPALLTPLWWISDSLAVVSFLAKLLSLACMAAWIWLVRSWLKKDLELGGAAEWLSIIVAASPWSLFLGTSVLPDALFALLSMASALLVMKALERTEGSVPPQVWGAAALAAGAFLLRTTGVALIAATVLYLALRQRRSLFPYLLTTCLLVLPWLWWQAGHPAPQDVWEIYYSKASYGKGHILAGYELVQIVLVVSLNLLYLALGWIPGILSFWVFVTVLCGLVGIYFSLRGAWQERTGPNGFLALWALLYTGILVAWVWPPGRYFAPILPLTLGLGALGLRSWQRQSEPSHWKGRLWAYRYWILIAFALNGLGRSAYCAYFTNTAGTPVVTTRPAEPWTGYEEVGQWIRNNTPPDAVLSTNLDPLLYLMTGRKAIRAFRHSPYNLFYGEGNPSEAVGSVEELRSQLKKHQVTYMVLTPMNGFREGDLFPEVWSGLQKRNPAAIQLRRRAAIPGYAIYEIKPEAL